MAQSLVLHGLIRRRAELSGEIAKLRRRLDALRMDLHALDHCLVMWGHAAPETIKPVEVRGPRQRLNVTAFILDTMREADAPVTSDHLVAALMRHMQVVNRDDETIRRHMLVVLSGLRSLQKRGLVQDGVDGWRIVDE